ncbi:MAG: hypothetical protein BAJATHORv1_10228 [Candidatus Thorarchaeota archaeon]|nr:MAG: hypothetical protein BAJATHORv1_10228 [Candidatus Thorarchaeota archaeon]
MGLIPKAPPYHSIIKQVYIELSHALSKILIFLFFQFFHISVKYLIAKIAVLGLGPDSVFKQGVFPKGTKKYGI